MTETKKTPLYEVHKQLKGNIVDFHGVLLPVFYSTIQEEHHAVRNGAGIFDVSHMGNIEFEFKDFNSAVQYFNKLLPNDFSKIYPGKMIYSTMLYENGTVVDDLMVCAITETRYHVVVNSANIEKDYNWIIKNSPKDIKISNLSDKYAIIAVQGPSAHKIISAYFKIDTTKMKFLSVTTTTYNKKEIIISRSGYTGEDGFEICLNSSDSINCFTDLLKDGKSTGLIPCGLGSRDTLRLESGLPLYGQELDDSHSPLQSMVAWSVKLNKSADFIGKTALIKDKDSYKQKMIGFEVPGRAIPRTGMTILNDKQVEIGVVTSGTFAPTIKKNIGVAFINKEYTGSDQLFLSIRNRQEPIVLVDIPFYKRSYTI